MHLGYFPLGFLLVRLAVQNLNVTAFRPARKVKVAVTFCLMSQAPFDADTQNSSEHVLPSDGTPAHRTVIPARLPEPSDLQGEEEGINAC